MRQRRAPLGALKKAGVKTGDMALDEANEAYACVPPAWLQALDADPERLDLAKCHQVPYLA
jgi:acetyl-CoA acetyltransferase